MLPHEVLLSSNACGQIWSRPTLFADVGSVWNWYLWDLQIPDIHMLKSWNWGWNVQIWTMSLKYSTRSLTKDLSSPRIRTVLYRFARERQRERESMVHMLEFSWLTKHWNTGIWTGDRGHSFHQLHLKRLREKCRMATSLALLCARKARNWDQNDTMDKIWFMSRYQMIWHDMMSMIRIRVFEVWCYNFGLLILAVWFSLMFSSWFPCPSNAFKCNHPLVPVECTNLKPPTNWCTGALHQALCTYIAIFFSSQPSPTCPRYSRHHEVDKFTLSLLVQMTARTWWEVLRPILSTT